MTGVDRKSVNLDPFCRRIRTSLRHRDRTAELKVSCRLFIVQFEVSQGRKEKPTASFRHKFQRHKHPDFQSLSYRTQIKVQESGHMALDLAK